MTQYTTISEIIENFHSRHSENVLEVECVNASVDMPHPAIQMWYISLGALKFTESGHHFFSRYIRLTAASGRVGAWWTHVVAVYASHMKQIPRSEPPGSRLQYGHFDSEWQWCGQPYF